MYNDPDNRFAIQDRAYAFPYHYLPFIAEGTTPVIGRVLGWGFEYLTYMLWVRDVVAKLRPRSVLDVGCGDGRMVQMLEGLVGRRVGVDPSPQAIAFARAFNPDAEFVLGSADDVSGTFEVAVCVETLEHIPDDNISSFVDALASRLDSNGILVVSVPSTLRKVHVKHYRHYTPELLADHLGRHFRVEECCYLHRDTWLSHSLNRLVTNRWWTINARPILRALWKIHRQRFFFAPDRAGSHVVGVYRRVQAEVAPEMSCE